MSGEETGPWRRVEVSVVLAIHDRQLAEHGGADGIRDKGALDAALTGPAKLAANGAPDAAALASAYICGLAMSHAFIDGNKRTAWVTGRRFLADNGFDLAFDPADAVGVMVRRRGRAHSGGRTRQPASHSRARPHHRRAGEALAAVRGSV